MHVGSRNTRDQERVRGGGENRENTSAVFRFNVGYTIRPLMMSQQGNNRSVSSPHSVTHKKKDKLNTFHCTVDAMR
jgi:hypothetical protein